MATKNEDSGDTAEIGTNDAASEENYEEMAFTDEEVEPEENAVAPDPMEFRAPLEIHADGGLGAFVGMLALSAVAYAAAAALVVYQISEYAAPGFFPWTANMP